MERRTVLMSGPLLADMLCHKSEHRGYRVVSGLPRDARLVQASLADDDYSDTVALVFEGSFAVDASEPFTVKMTRIGGP